MKKSVLFILFSLVGCICGTHTYAEVHEGVCGEHLTWTLDTSNGALVIEGYGDMYATIPYDSTSWRRYGSIRSVQLPEGLTSIGGWAFSNCEALKSIAIPDGVKVLKDYAFYNSGLTSVILPNSVTDIQKNAFDACKSLESCDLGRGIRNIGSQCFAECYKLKSLKWSDCLETIGNACFIGFSTQVGVDVKIPLQDTLVFPATFRSTNPIFSCETDVKVIVWNARHPEGDGGGPLYSYYTAFDKVILGPEVEIIPSALFRNQTKLDTIILPENVTSIGAQAFNGCTNLKYVYIPASVTSIGASAFYNCKNLKQLVLPNGISEIPEQLCQACTALDSVKLPDGVGVIRTKAFNCCTSLHSIHLPNSITTIGNTVFTGCPLDTVVLPSSLNVLGDGVFNQLNVTSGPSRLVLPDKLVATGMSTFANWSNLHEITIGKNVAILGNGCFDYDSLVTDIICYASQPPIIYDETFYGVPDTATVHVLPSSVASYKAAQYWSRFRIVALPDSTLSPKTVTVDAAETTANFTWPTDEEANSYQIDIYKDGTVFCKLTLGAKGQLLGIAFSSPGRNRQSTAGSQHSDESDLPNALSFMVTGLDKASRYSYVLSTLDEEGTPLHVYIGDFATTGYEGELQYPNGNEVMPTPPIIPGDPDAQSTIDGLEQVNEPSEGAEAQSAKKVLRGLQLLIFRGGKEYTMQGQML
ncbi:MAG: leucine-rich repeat protein [Paludibacteraceae bacterium]|nr:leucine-rich repeat protein [Paludibacteraceae bacterium]